MSHLAALPKWEEHASAHHGAPLSPQVRACRPKTCLNLLRSWVGLPPLSKPWASASGRRNVVVEAAAEPDDIKWENLGVDETFRTKQTAKTLSATICLLVIAFACLVGAQVLERDL